MVFIFELMNVRINQMSIHDVNARIVDLFIIFLIQSFLLSQNSQKDFTTNIKDEIMAKIGNTINGNIKIHVVNNYLRI